jgi:hypothetical protein
MVELEHIAIELPREHANYLTQFAREQGLTVSEAVDRLVLFLSRTRDLKTSGETASLVGILNEPSSMWDYLTRKYS